MLQYRINKKVRLSY